MPHIPASTTLPLDPAALRAELAERVEQVHALQAELDETNRGVVALYAELDEQATQLRRATAKLQAIYEQAPGGIALLDADGRVVEANPALAQLLRRPAADLVGCPLRDFADEAWAADLDGFVQRRSGRLERREVPMLRADGRVVHIEWSVRPDIEPGLTLLLANDVSQRVELARLRQQWLERERAARGEAEQGSRMKDDFIAVLAHELRTPLNAIGGWAQVLRHRAGEDAQRGVAAIERNCATLARMISDLLDMSRLRLGKLAMSFEPIRPAVEVAEAVQALRPAFEERGVMLAVEAPEGLRPVQADASRLQQVVWNLLTNALKFTPHGGRVTVALAEEGEELVLRVVDTGQGIPPEFLPCVFDRFAQGEAAGANRHKGGLGLGLAIVKQVVEAHGGRIGVASEGAGRGATFEVRLPVAAPADAAAQAGPAASLDGMDILVVDDDPDASAVLAVVLGDRGARVRVANDVDAGLALLAARRPDALVSDVGMPGKDGYAFVREIRQRDAASGAARLPAVALTSFKREQDRRESLAAGFDAHCGKPLKPLEIVRQLRVLVPRAGNT